MKTLVDSIMPMVSTDLIATRNTSPGAAHQCHTDNVQQQLRSRSVWSSKYRLLFRLRSGA